MDLQTQTRAEEFLIKSRFPEAIEACLVALGTIKQPSRDTYRLCIILLQSLHEAGRFSEAKDILSNKFDGFMHIDFDTVCLWSVLALAQKAPGEVAKTMQKYLHVNGVSLSDDKFAVGSRLLCIETFAKELEAYESAQAWLDKHAQKRSKALYTELTTELKKLQEAQAKKAATFKRIFETPFGVGLDPLKGQSNSEGLSAWPNLRADQSGAQPHSAKEETQAQNSRSSNDRLSADGSIPKAGRNGPASKQSFSWINVAVLVAIFYIYFVDRSSLVRWIQRLGMLLKDSLLSLGRLALGFRPTPLDSPQTV